MPPLTESQIQALVSRLGDFYTEPTAEDFVDQITGQLQPEILASQGLSGATGVAKFTKTFEYLAYAYFQENPWISLEQAGQTVEGLRLSMAGDENSYDDGFQTFINQNITAIISIENLRGSQGMFPVDSANFRNVEEELRTLTNSLTPRIKPYVLEATSFTFMVEPITDLTTGFLNEAGTEREDFAKEIDYYIQKSPELAPQLKGFFSNIDPGVMQQFLREHRELLIDSFMESGTPFDQVNNFMGNEASGWLSTQQTQIRTLIAASDPQINFNGFDPVLDPYIKERLRTGHLPPDMYADIHSEIKNWIAVVQFQNPDLSKEEVAELVTDQRLDTLVTHAVLDPISTQPGMAEFLEALEGSGHKVAGLILRRYEEEESSPAHPMEFTDIYDFTAQLYQFGEAIGIPKPTAPVDPDRISQAVFYKQVFPSIFAGIPEDFIGSGESAGTWVDGMSVYMRTKVINGLMDRAALEGFSDIITSDNVNDLRSFFGRGMARSVAEEVVRNELRAFGDMGQLLLDQLDVNGLLIPNFMGLEIPRNTFTGDSFTASITGILSELYPEEVEFDVESATSSIVLPLIDGLPTALQAEAVIAGNNFMALQRSLYPEMDDEDILEMVGEDGGSFEEYITFEMNETFSAKFANDPLLQDLFEAAGGAIKFFRGMLPADPDVDFNVNTFFKTLPQHVRDLQGAGDLEGKFDGIDPDIFGAAFEAEAERNAEAPEDAVVDFSDTTEGAFILEQQRQRNQRNAERGLFDPALEKLLRDSLGIGRADDVLRDFGDEFFENYRRANPNIFLDQPSVQTPEDVEATEAREEADEAMFEAAEVLPEEEEPLIQTLPNVVTGADESEMTLLPNVRTPDSGESPEEVLLTDEVIPDEIIPELEVPEPPPDLGPTPQELANIAAAQQAQLEENIQTSVGDFFSPEDILSSARQSRTSRLRFFTAGPRGGSRNTLARNIPLTQRGGR